MIKASDVVIIMGTSLKVYPFAGLIDEVIPPTKMIYINKGIKDKELEKMFEAESNVFLDGEVDTWCHKICEYLKWNEEFSNLLQKTTKIKPNSKIEDMTDKMKDLKIEEKKEIIPEKSLSKDNNSFKKEVINEIPTGEAVPQIIKEETKENNITPITGKPKL